MDNYYFEALRRLNLLEFCGQIFVYMHQLI